MYSHRINAVAVHHFLHVFLIILFYLTGRRRHGELSCPVCRLSLHPMDLESHLLNEVEQLICISQIRRQQQLREPMACSSSQESPNSGNHKKEGSLEMSQDSRWDVSNNKDNLMIII